MREVCQTYKNKKWSVSSFLRYSWLTSKIKCFYEDFENNWVKFANFFHIFSLVLWEDILTLPKLDHLVLWVWKFEESPDQLLNGWESLYLKDWCIKIEFSSAIFSWNLRVLQSLKSGLLYMCISSEEKRKSQIPFFVR